MRRIGLGLGAVTGFFLQGLSASAQSSIDILDQDLKQIKQEHQEANSQLVANFFSQLDAAARSPDAAISLYQQANGAMPPSAPVIKHNEVETPDEKAAREAQDAAYVSSLAYAVQLHCGLMHFAALFIVKPDQKGLQQDWVAWLKSAAQVYPQIRDIDDSRPDAVQDGGGGDGRRGQHGGGRGQNAKPTPVNDFKGVAVRSSGISSFLGFHGWGDKEQGGWSVRDVPELYRTNVLEPLRVTPTAETLAAWDAYIAMKNVDQPSADTWNQVDYPSLEFDRGCDDYTIEPDTEKLQALVEIIKANPSHPKLDDMIARVHQLLDDYRVRHPGQAAPAQPATTVAPTPSDPNVTVTTSTQGDMTIITTHTNAPPANPAPPAPPAQ